MLFALIAAFPISGRTPHPFSNGAPLGGWLSQEDLDEFQGQGHVTKQRAEKTLLRAALHPRRGDTPFGSGQQRKPRENMALSMKVMRSQLK